jgi:aminoglycoside phosphotransferase (APT) family kinase protein
MTLEDCLPPELRGPTTTITRIAAGLSGAGVYRVDVAGQSYVLKTAAQIESEADWRGAVGIQRLAAEAGLAPRLIHVDESRRAVVTAFVEDRSFVSFYRDPRTHQAALSELGRTVRRIHDIPLPADVRTWDPHELLRQIAAGMQDFALPDFARQATERVLAEEPPPVDRTVRPVVLGHNDLNPSNFVHDGAAIQILDWATAGAMEPYYDLAVLALFLRMDEGTCRALLTAYQGTPVGELPPRLLHDRRLVGAFAGTMSLTVARQQKHPGASGAETREATLGLGDFYQQMRAGVLRLGTPEGQWAFGLALLKESLAL